MIYLLPLHCNQLVYVKIVSDIYLFNTNYEKYPEVCRERKDRANSVWISKSLLPAVKTNIILALKRSMKKLKYKLYTITV